MSMRKISFADLAAGRVPDDLAGVRWPDGTVECRFNVIADDYPVRALASWLEAGDAEVLLDPAIECDRCVDKCG